MGRRGRRLALFCDDGTCHYDKFFYLRASLLNLAIESAKAPAAVNPSRLHVLIVEEENATLRSELAALARSTAPNTTIHFAESRAAAHVRVNAQAAASSPIQLVLLGGTDRGLTPGLLQALVHDLDPRVNLCDDMRSKPLIATLDHSVLSRSDSPNDLYDLGVDAVMSTPLTAASLHVLLDFAGEVDEVPVASAA